MYAYRYAVDGEIKGVANLSQVEAGAPTPSASSLSIFLAWLHLPISLLQHGLATISLTSLTPSSTTENSQEYARARQDVGNGINMSVRSGFVPYRSITDCCSSFFVYSPSQQDTRRLKRTRR